MSQYFSELFASSNGRDREVPQSYTGEIQGMARSPRLSWWRWHQQKQSCMVFPNMHITSEEKKTRTSSESDPGSEHHDSWTDEGMQSQIFTTEGMQNISSGD